MVYLTDHEKTVAVDALTGREIWKTMVEYPPETTRVVCCGIVNRGAALFDGKLFRTTLDANVIALDAKTGKEVWRTKSSDPKDGYSMTVAPLVANGVVIAGVAGAEYGIRGYLEGFDAQTGKSLWRTYTIPDEGRARLRDLAGDDLEDTAAARTWITGSYDPELDLVYWGTGNPAPWNPLNRKGDNLYTNSVLAIRPKTGKVVWHYPDDAGRSVRLRRRQRVDPRRPPCRWRTAQGRSCRRTATAISMCSSARPASSSPPTLSSR